MSITYKLIFQGKLGRLSIGTNFFGNRVYKNRWIFVWSADDVEQSTQVEYCEHMCFPSEPQYPLGATLPSTTTTKRSATDFSVMMPWTPWAEFRVISEVTTDATRRLRITYPEKYHRDGAKAARVLRGYSIDLSGNAGSITNLLQILTLDKAPLLIKSFELPSASGDENAQDGSECDRGTSKPRPDAEATDGVRELDGKAAEATTVDSSPVVEQVEDDGSDLNDKTPQDSDEALTGAELPEGAGSGESSIATPVDGGETPDSILPAGLLDKEAPLPGATLASNVQPSNELVVGVSECKIDVDIPIDAPAAVGFFNDMEVPAPVREVSSTAAVMFGAVADAGAGAIAKATDAVSSLAASEFVSGAGRFVEGAIDVLENAAWVGPLFKLIKLVRKSITACKDYVQHKNELEENLLRFEKTLDALRGLYPTKDTPPPAFLLAWLDDFAEEAMKAGDWLEAHKPTQASAGEKEGWFAKLRSAMTTAKDTLLNGNKLKQMIDIVNKRWESLHMPLQVETMARMAQSEQRMQHSFGVVLGQIETLQGMSAAMAQAFRTFVEPDTHATASAVCETNIDLSIQKLLHEMQEQAEQRQKDMEQKAVEEFNKLTKALGDYHVKNNETVTLMAARVTIQTLSADDIKAAAEKAADAEGSRQRYNPARQHNEVAGIAAAMKRGLRVISGAAGSGKSHLLKNMTYAHYAGTTSGETLKDEMLKTNLGGIAPQMFHAHGIKHVVFIRLRDLPIWVQKFWHTCKTLEELVVRCVAESCNYDDSNESHRRVLAAMLFNRAVAQQTVYLLDGFDEIPGVECLVPNLKVPEEPDKSTEIREHFIRTQPSVIDVMELLVNQPNVLVSTRPRYAGDLVINQFLQLNYLTDDDVKSFITRSLLDNKDLLKILSTHSELREALCLPLLLDKFVKASELNKNFANELTGTRGSVVLKIYAEMDRSYRAELRSRVETDCKITTGQDAKVEEILHIISKIAFMSFKQNGLGSVIDIKGVQLDKDLLPAMLKAGIVDRLYSADSTFVEFSHRSIQEMYAAKYIIDYIREPTGKAVTASATADSADDKVSDTTGTAVDNTPVEDTAAAKESAIKSVLAQRSLDMLRRFCMLFIKSEKTSADVKNQCYRRLVGLMCPSLELPDEVTPELQKALLREAALLADCIGDCDSPCVIPAVALRKLVQDVWTKEPEKIAPLVKERALWIVLQFVGGGQVDAAMKVLRSFKSGDSVNADICVLAIEVLKLLPPDATVVDLLSEVQARCEPKPVAGWFGAPPPSISGNKDLLVLTALTAQTHFQANNASSWVALARFLVDEKAKKRSLEIVKLGASRFCELHMEDDKAVGFINQVLQGTSIRLPKVRGETPTASAAATVTELDPDHVEFPASNCPQEAREALFKACDGKLLQDKTLEHVYFDINFAMIIRCEAAWMRFHDRQSRWIGYNGSVTSDPFIPGTHPFHVLLALSGAEVAKMDAKAREHWIDETNKFAAGSRLYDTIVDESLLPPHLQAALKEPEPPATSRLLAAATCNFHVLPHLSQVADARLADVSFEAIARPDPEPFRIARIAVLYERDKSKSTKESFICTLLKAVETLDLSTIKLFLRISSAAPANTAGTLDTAICTLLHSIVAVIDTNPSAVKHFRRELATQALTALVQTQHTRSSLAEIVAALRLSLASILGLHCDADVKTACGSNEWVAALTAIHGSLKAHDDVMLPVTQLSAAILDWRSVATPEMLNSFKPIAETALHSGNVSLAAAGALLVQQMATGPTRLDVLREERELLGKMIAAMDKHSANEFVTGNGCDLLLILCIDKHLLEVLTAPEIAIIRRACNKLGEDFSFLATRITSKA